MSSQTPGQVSVQEANDIHRLLLADSAFYWEGGTEGCFARALLMVDRMECEGIPTGAIGKLLVVHKSAPKRGWDVRTRLAGTQCWVQHIVPTLETAAGPFVIDPTLCDLAEEERQWLERFPAERVNLLVPPTQQFLQALLHATDVAFRQLLALAASRAEFYKYLLGLPAVVARLEQLGTPVRNWLERRGPVLERFDPHLAGLSAEADQAGPVVRGEIVRIAHGSDLFTDVFWDTAGPDGQRGKTDATDYLNDLRDGAKP